MQEPGMRRVDVKEFGDLQEGMIFRFLRSRAGYGNKYKIIELIGETIYTPMYRPAYKVFEISYVLIGDSMPPARHTFSENDLQHWHFWVEENKNLSSRNPYGVGEESETKGYLDGCTGLRWL